jgi:hypothetical protein
MNDETAYGWNGMIVQPGIRRRADSGVHGGLAAARDEDGLRPPSSAGLSGNLAADPSTLADRPRPGRVPLTPDKEGGGLYPTIESAPPACFSCQRASVAAFGK